MTITAEITFMVYEQRSAGVIEKRTMELSQEDYTTCTSSTRNDNDSPMKIWAKSLFPSAFDVQIETICKK
jgi:hypothetical protein